MLFHQYQITSRQEKPARHLHEIIDKHFRKVYLRPIPLFVEKEFERVQGIIARAGKPIILDSCCGTGMSTRVLAKTHPKHLIVGLDRSAARLSKGVTEQPENCIFARTNCEDMWRLISEARWPIEKHFLLYPNPYPKLRDLKKRWHGHPVFETMLKLAPSTEVRSDWGLYLEEMAWAVQFLGGKRHEVTKIWTETPLTAFEAKYLESGRTVYQLKIDSSMFCGIGRS